MHSLKFIQFLVYTLNLIECLLFEFVSSSRMSSPSILLFDEKISLSLNIVRSE